MIYLDSAATTLQKPGEVARASSWAIRHMASPGRGGHRPAMAAAEVVYACREAAAQLFQVPDPEQVVFTFNATHGLNIAIKTLVKPGGRVVISGYEHNAVTRPLHAIPNVEVRVARGPLFDPKATADAFRQALEQPTDAVVCTQVSNVFGYVLPVKEISLLCREKGVPLIVDASQAAGCVPVSYPELGAAFIAMPGHKGLYGPQGTGILLCRDGGDCILEGGTGSNSRFADMPDFLPDRLEAGTHNVAGIAGLLEGIRYVQRQGVDTIRAHESRLIRAMGAGLNQMPGVTAYQALRRPDCQSGVLSFRVSGWDCEELAGELGQRGVAMRAGLHCAPLAHETAGTLETGTIRASVSAFNTMWEIRRFLGELSRLLGQQKP